MRFEDFARLHGLILNYAISDGKIRRVPTEMKPRKRNGAYMFDGQRGWVKLWDADGETHWWNDPSARPWSEADKKAWLAKRELEKAARQRMYQRAADRAVLLVNECVRQPHLYLQVKALGDTPALVNPKDELIVPMRHVDTGKLVGTQRIFWQRQDVDADGVVVKAHWEKKFQWEIDPRLAVMRLGPPRASETWLVEGYATGLSVELALRRMSSNASVVICFSDHNMVKVAERISGKKYVFADHDLSCAGQKAAVAIGAPAAMSPVVGEDANDVHQRAGILEVCRLIMAARSG